ncbi:ABC transporter ATP-binding protein [Iamia sp.]|uniref:ABC transporter ATP-binding protein n=1 Tax=Iamia sp. TaxID=2722710 RepID=UPI002BA7B40B|nr:ABC transporter ATP-binding protein [Iamia sp.]HXH56847.1 ABC transporter ATP-binding protein [Iamia sp.]
MRPLRAEAVVRAGTFTLDVSLSVAPGEVVGLLGPNGAGKSTLLRAVAGLTAVDNGRIALGDEALDDPAAGTRVAPERRPVGMVFQDLRLFPHLSARDNVAFGARSRGMRRAEADARADAWLNRVGLSAQSGSKPPQLSGGQAQRVALARALATDPEVLLLDEPLSALDATTRAEVRRDLRTHLAAFVGPVLIVTHDAVDALTLAHRLVVLDGGRVIQEGTPAEIARRPRSRWVADLVGLTLLAGRVEVGGSVRLDDGGAVVATALGPIGPEVPAAGDDVYVAIRPRSVALHRRRPEGSPRNVWPATVEGVEAAADRVRVATVGAVPVTAEITPGALADLALAPGDAVWVAVKATEVDVYQR